MFGSKKFGVCCTVAAVVALFVGMLAGTASVVAQDPLFVPPTSPVDTVPPTIMPVLVPPPVVAAPPVLMPVLVPPPVVDPVPPRPADSVLYQYYLVRLFQLKADMLALTTRIGIYEAVAAADPEDPFIAYDLQIMWHQLWMMEIELTEVRFVLSTLTP